MTAQPTDKPRTRFPAWKRALLDIHYWMILVRDGIGPVHFIKHHPDIYPYKISRMTGAGAAAIEYAERMRIIGNQFWFRLEDHGYPPMGRMYEIKNEPVCSGVCSLAWFFTHQAGDVDLSIVPWARGILDYSVRGKLFAWPADIPEPIVNTDDSYELALAKYLGLEVEDVLRYKS